MTLNEVIDGLNDLILDRESFIDRDDPDDMFTHDKEVLEEAVTLLHSTHGGKSDAAPQHRESRRGTMTTKEMLQRLMDDFNFYSELVALNYEQRKEGGCDEGILQWNRGSLNRIEEYLKVLAGNMGVGLIWECDEHTFGYDDWKRQLTYRTVRLFPGGEYQLRQGDGCYLEMGGVRFYAGEKNEVELLTPDGWRYVLLELDDKLGWIATAEEYSDEKGFHIATLDLCPVGLFARLPQ